MKCSCTDFNIVHPAQLQKPVASLIHRRRYVAVIVCCSSDQHARVEWAADHDIHTRSRTGIQKILRTLSFEKRVTSCQKKQIEVAVLHRLKADIRFVHAKADRLDQTRIT